MIRKINTFQYYKKTFKCWDLTVWDYLYYIEEPEEALKKILLEFNKELPKMNSLHMKSFLKILFDVKDNNKSSKEQDKEYILDIYHNLICITAKNLNQPISEVLNLTLRSFNKIQSDFDVILNPEKFTDKLEKNKVDKKELRELKNIISK